jgi:hypothetical protein
VAEAVGFEGYAVIPGFVGASWAGDALAGAGGLGEGGKAQLYFWE